MKSSIAVFLIVMAATAGCSKSAVKPVDIFPEDMCSHCRMSVSNQAFAAEIITENGEALKFDDIGCMEEFTRNSKDVKMAGAFVKDYETKEWLPLEKSTIIVTGIATPMGSGKIACGDSVRAAKIRSTFSAGNSAEKKKEQ